MSPPAIANPVIMLEDYLERAMAVCDGRPLRLWKTTGHWEGASPTQL